jgi:hypothetical protein
MGGKNKVYQATWLQKVEPVYFAKDSAGITLKNTVGASFGGERWFCSENEAIAAGWRPAKF